MKKLLLIPCLFVCLNAWLSCHSNNDEEKVVAPLKDSLPNPSLETAHYWWEASLNDGPRMEMKQQGLLSPDSLTVSYVLSRMNAAYPEIEVLPVNQYHDTMAVKIPKSMYLTEQIGSSGAQAYLAELTFNLTEVPGIHFVTILFKAGDHASPDTYERKDFEQPQ